MGTDLFDVVCGPDRVDHSVELERRRRARLTTARLARDRDDLARLLSVLGSGTSRAGVQRMPSHVAIMATSYSWPRWQQSPSQASGTARC